jgi:hypothetical protein
MVVRLVPVIPASLPGTSRWITQTRNRGKALTRTVSAGAPHFLRSIGVNRTAGKRRTIAPNDQPSTRTPYT